MHMPKDFTIQRQQLVDLLQQNGISDERVLQAIAAVPREMFIDSSFQPMAYANQALPLVLGQTISQPLMVAIMTQALQLSGREKVLEIGTGSGYQTFILARLCQHVYSVERYPQLSDQADARLDQLGCANVSLLIGDGSIGWVDHAPYDRILVTAAAPHVPAQLLEQLDMDGFLVVPVGDQAQQELQVIQRTHSGMQIHSLGRCVFVPLIGEDAWR
ncbi:protein-L-isoaspartate(D-aspartate) O-methyltransferase [Dictyobacter aurantiacus]|uniref:Protein-L-isoaspartate O-methyltransferase n=1 Tax=Dictyobacter aurantiacus TaxID=1936993 RepID=A0A401ZHS3_9CHLR|nr:protein-L-isoaspartate(D-aspartate) O-methyltransferase [Dictyobacter aurantiacus]GCE06412.1 protein-L-isoaspartate O-methyltransferase [Dictyobacter aurantiacus]